MNIPGSTSTLIFIVSAWGYDYQRVQDFPSNSRLTINISSIGVMLEKCA